MDPEPAAVDVSQMTPAQLRLWKRRQKILSSGKDRMNKVSGFKAAAETKGTEVTVAPKDVEETADDIIEQQLNLLEEELVQDSTDPTPPAENIEPEKAAWEVKWEKAAEKAQQDEKMEMPEIPIQQVEKESEDSGLRFRGTTAKEKEESTSVKAETPSEGSMKLRTELRKMKNTTWLRLIRLLVTIISAVALGAYVCSAHHVSVVNSLSGEFDLNPAVEHVPLTEGEEEVTIEWDSDDEVADYSEEDFMDEKSFVPAPLEGWLSIPISLCLLQVSSHLLFTILDPKAAPSMFEPSTGMAALAEKGLATTPLNKFIDISKLLRSAFEDTALFLFIFTLTVTGITVGQSQVY